jgi:hypothetical protein
VNHTIEAFIVDEYGDNIGSHQAFDTVFFSARNAIFTWFFYETFDAHECHNGLNGLGIERTYSCDDLHTCRSRLLYYFEEDITDLERYINTYIEEKNITDTVKELADLVDSDVHESFERECNYDPLNIGLTVGYILKFVDHLIEQDEYIKLNFI